MFFLNNSQNRPKKILYFLRLKKWPRKEQMAKSLNLESCFKKGQMATMDRTNFGCRRQAFMKIFTNKGDKFCKGPNFSIIFIKRKGLILKKCIDIGINSSDVKTGENFRRGIYSPC
jgi:hypothetical protein